MLTTEQVTTIAERRSAGEGLEAIIADMGLPVQATLIELRDKHREPMNAAKKEQRRNNG